MSEKEQLISLKNGNVAGLNWVFSAYYPTIYNYTLRLIRIPELAEEATSEVFLVLWKKRDIVNPDAPIQAFLFYIAKFTAYNFLKKIANEKKLRDQFKKQYSPPLVNNGEQLLLQKEEMAELVEMINHLPPKRQEVFKLRYLDGLDNPTIAQQLNISINTVKVHLAKARQFCQEYLAVHGEVTSLVLVIFILQA